MEPYVENATALAGYDEEIDRNFSFLGREGGCKNGLPPLFVYGMPPLESGEVSA